ncbi:MAG: hypothetical protein COA96_12345 [SAR86 cluster bacterium]|uniref:DUF4398 domain-containing protein n=1 Tax=SAR86 cluster bacterium TaxID=2030880 RepID=A0A2A5AVH8_9GAMM|nr:MAG: hypothetical protein COA96_12345 [SAR86 cluster bacterium]
MRYHINFGQNSSSFKLAVIRALTGILLMTALASCASQGAQEAELAAQEAARVAIEQEAASLAQEQERLRAAEISRQQQEQAAEQARLQAQRDRQAAEIQARADAERRQQEELQRQVRAREAAIAAVEAERQQKLDRITALEQQITSISASVGDSENNTEFLQQAISVAEELLDVLASEQEKYEDTDSQGNTLRPLAKDLIAELEARKDELIRRAGTQ